MRYDDDNLDNEYSPRRRRIDFDDDDFGGEREMRPRRRGERDADWSDDIAERDADRPRRQYSSDYNNAPRPRRSSDYEYGPDDDREIYAPKRQRPSRRRPEPQDDYDMDYNTDGPRPPFRKRHPVLFNFLCIVTLTVLLGWMAMWFLDFWTFHGQERVVPDVKGQGISVATSNVSLSGLRAEVADSVYDSYSRPGTVMEQTPIPGAKVKKGGTVYLTIVAYTPKLVTVPDFYNMSVRQARSVFESLGLREVREVPVVSEYEGLVLGAKFNGVPLQPGARIPISAVVTLEVGSGYQGMYEEEEDSLSMIIDSAFEELNLE